MQQGMNGDRKQARRYHWLSEGLKSFVDDPHAAIDGVGQGEIINLADRRAEASRNAQLELLTSLGPDRIVREFLTLDPSDEQPARSDRAAHAAASCHAAPSRCPCERRDRASACTATSLRRPTGGRRIFQNCC